MGDWAAPLGAPRMRNWWYSDGTAHHAGASVSERSFEKRAFPKKLHPQQPFIEPAQGIPANPERNAYRKFLQEHTLSRKPPLELFPPQLPRERYAPSESNSNSPAAFVAPPALCGDDPQVPMLEEIESHLSRLRARLLEMNATPPPPDPPRRPRPLPSAAEVRAQRQALIQAAFDKGDEHCQIHERISPATSPKSDRACGGRHTARIHRTAQPFCPPGRIRPVGPKPLPAGCERAASPHLGASAKRKRARRPVRMRSRADKYWSGPAAVLDAALQPPPPDGRQLELGLKGKDFHALLGSTSGFLNQLREDEAHLASLMRGIETARVRPPEKDWYALGGPDFAGEYRRNEAFVGDGAAAVAEYRGMLGAVDRGVGA